MYTMVDVQKETPTKIMDGSRNSQKEGSKWMASTRRVLMELQRDCLFFMVQFM